MPPENVATSPDCAPALAAGSQPRSAKVHETLTDEELAHRAAQGDLDAFDQLARRFERPIYGFLYRLLQSPEDAEDLAQETFLNLYRNLGKFDSHRKFKPWAFQIASNLAISHQRKKKAPTVSLEETSTRSLVQQTADSPQQLAEKREFHQRLKDAIAELPPDAQGIFQLRYNEELSIDEIATVMNKGPSAIKVALHRTRNRLREILFPERKEQP